FVSPGKNRQKRMVWFEPDSPNMNTFVASVPGSRSTTVCVELKPRLGLATQRPVWLSDAACATGASRAQASASVARVRADVRRPRTCTRTGGLLAGCGARDAIRDGCGEFGGEGN